MGKIARNPVVRLLSLTMLLIVLPMTVVSLFVLGVSQRALTPEMSRKGIMVAQSVSLQVERALAYDIPLDQLVGMEDFLGQILKANPDVSYLALKDGRGKLIYSQGVPAAVLARLLESEQPGAAANGRTEGVFELLAGLANRLAGEAQLETPRRGDYYDSASPVRKSGQTLGTVHVGVSIALFHSQIENLIFDTGIIFLTSLLIAFEVLLVVVTTNLSGPIQQLSEVLRAGATGDFSSHIGARGSEEVGRVIGFVNRIIESLHKAYADLQALIERVKQSRPEREAQMAIAALVAQIHEMITVDRGEGRRTSSFRAVNVRTPTFLFIFAEEVARPFLPVFIKNVAAASQMPSSQIVISLPISVFMLVVALAMPSMAVWSDRVGRRKTFAVGAIISTVGLIGTALAFSFYDLLFWRGLSGLGYATTFVACQGFVLDNTDDQNRAKGVSMFVGGITAADICGPAIGGLMAERIGFAGTFLFGAAMAFIAAAIALQALRDRRKAKVRPPFSLSGFVTVLKNGRFLALILFAAIPAKLLLSGVFFFLVPLLMTDLGATQSEIGRLAMTYGLANLVLSPLFAGMADRRNCHGALIGIGSLMAGIGMIPVLFECGLREVAIAVILLGVGHSMSVSPQLAIALRVCRDEVRALGQAPVVGTYRLTERMGGAIGPFVVAGMVGKLGYQQTMALMGVAAVFISVAFSVTFLVFGMEKDPEDEPDEPAMDGVTT